MDCWRSSACPGSRGSWRRLELRPGRAHHDWRWVLLDLLQRLVAAHPVGDPGLPADARRPAGIRPTTIRHPARTGSSSGRVPALSGCRRTPIRPTLRSPARSAQAPSGQFACRWARLAQAAGAALQPDRGGPPRPESVTALDHSSQTRETSGQREDRMSPSRGSPSPRQIERTRRSAHPSRAIRPHSLPNSPQAEEHPSPGVVPKQAHGAGCGVARGRCWRPITVPRRGQAQASWEHCKRACPIR